jgi:hypothetical protein
MAKSRLRAADAAHSLKRHPLALRYSLYVGDDVFIRYNTPITPIDRVRSLNEFRARDATTMSSSRTQSAL